MNSKTTLSITEARKKIFEIAEDVQKPGVYYTLTENGRPKAVMLSYEEYESLMETLEVMEEFPNLEEDVKEAEEDFKKGNYITLENILAKQGFVLAEKPKNTYEVSNRSAKKGAKRS